MTTTRPGAGVIFIAASPKQKSKWAELPVGNWSAGSTLDSDLGTVPPHSNFGDSDETCRRPC